MNKKTQYLVVKLTLVYLLLALVPLQHQSVHFILIQHKLHLQTRHLIKEKRRWMLCYRGYEYLYLGNSQILPGYRKYIEGT